jgi:hypothetical protein
MLGSHAGRDVREVLERIPGMTSGGCAGAVGLPLPRLSDRPFRALSGGISYRSSHIRATYAAFWNSFGHG